MEGNIAGDAKVIAELNDLLQLDHDALGAYDIAINALTGAHAATVREFRGDHERHISDLRRLINERGGMPIELPHVPTGPMKLAMQKVGALAGDRGVLLAFKTNERQARDKYRRALERASSEDAVIVEVLRRAADDEQRHYTWALETLEDMGVTADSVAGKASRMFETGNARFADVMEGMEKGAMAATESARQAMKRQPVTAAVVAVGVGIAAAMLAAGGRRR